MAPRLLSLLTLIESALSQNESPSVAKGRPSRTVNFHKGLARAVFNDGSGSILLQGFTLADGQICVKAMLEWTGVSKPGVQAAERGSARAVRRRRRAIMGKQERER